MDRQSSDLDWGKLREQLDPQLRGAVITTRLPQPQDATVSVLRGQTDGLHPVPQPKTPK